MKAEERTAGMRNCYLSLGANLGEREEMLRLALELLGGLPQTELCRVSSFYETAPWGVSGQPDYLNAAAQIRTTYAPEELLEKIQSIEQRLGRVREKHWGARVIDIDLLHMEKVRTQTERLTLPHPYWRKRAFVLIPLAEIAGNVTIEGKNVKEHLALCQDTGSVVRAAGSPMDFGLKLIACVDQNRGLGRDGKLLFHFPEDMRRFRAMTLGHTVILGRKTFESLPEGKPLEQRRHLVLSRHGKFPEPRADAGGETVVQTASGLGELWKKLRPGDENFVIGGAEVYRELLPYCAEALLTVAQADGAADCFLPDLDAREEFVCSAPEIVRDEETGILMEFRRYCREEEIAWKFSRTTGQSI